MARVPRPVGRGDAVLHMLFLLASLFLLAVAVAALVFFPDLRQHLSQRLGASALQLQRQGTSTGEALRARTGAAGVLLGQEMGRWGGMAWRRRQLLALSLLALLLLPGAAVWWRLSHRVDSYDHTVAQDVDEHVAMLLQGEQLVPPPPLPPVLFSTPEVNEWHPLAQQASRQWELLDGDFRQRLLQVFRVMEARYGYTMVLVEGYRSPQRQAQLAALGPTVTLAVAGASYHQYGLAADCAFMRDGKVAISERDPWVARGYELYGEVAASLGMTWGGSWRRLRDLGHVELRRPGVLRAVGPGGGNAAEPS